MLKLSEIINIGIYTSSFWNELVWKVHSLLIDEMVPLIIKHCLYQKLTQPWWRHEMETFSALLTLCAGNSPATGEFPSQRPVTWSFDVFLDLRLNKRLSKQSWCWWFETPWRSLWRHCNAILNSHPPNTVISAILVTHGVFPIGRWVCASNSKSVFLKIILIPDILNTSNEIGLRWMPRNPFIISQHWFR